MTTTLSQSAKTTSLGRQVRKGAAWSSLNSVVMRLGSFVMGIVAARLVTPDQFGVFTVALTVHMIVLNISDIGVGAYLVRHSGPLDAVAPTVATVSIATGALLAGAMATAAPMVSSALGAPQATSPVRVLSLTVLVAGIAAVPTALIQRSFRQDKRFLAEALSFVLSSALLVTLAARGGGAMALAWSLLAGHAAAAGMMILLAGHYHRPGFDRAQIALLFRFGLPLAGATLLGFTAANIDYMVIGRLKGAEPLGLYTLAYNVSSWPSSVIGAATTSVALAAFSRLRHDPDRLPAYVSTAIGCLLSVALPVSALTMALAKPLVLTVYGQRWVGAAGALSITALYGGLRVLVDLLTNVAISLGKTRAMLGCQTAYFVALAPLIVVGVRWLGITGAGWAHVLGATLVSVPVLVLVLRPVAGLKFRLLLHWGGPPVVAAATAGVVAHLMAGLTTNLVSGRAGEAWVALIVGGLCGLLAYLVVLGRWLHRLVGRSRSLWGSTAGTIQATD